MVDEKLKAQIEAWLSEGWSPEQIAGRLKREHGVTVVSHETIYATIYDQRYREFRWYTHLSKKRRSRQPRIARQSRKGKIVNRRDISERSEVINERRRVGDWEGDLILFKETKTNLITLRERKSRLMFALLNPSKGAENTSQHIIDHFQASDAKGLMASLTLDNGMEFAQHERISEALAIDIFFCKPYSSWQKGSIENGNRQLRRDLPRHTKIDQYTQADIDAIANRINNRPLKVLDFQTPAEVFAEALQSS